MKKALVFLVLFSASIFALWKFEQRFDRENELETIPIEIDEEIDAPEHSEVGYSMRGNFSADIYDEESGRIVLRVESENSLTQKAVDQLSDVTVILYDPSAEETARIGRITAAQALLPREGGGEALQPVHSKLVELEDVIGSMVDASTGEPIGFETSTALLDASLRDRTVLSGDVPITIDSAEFDAGGTGYQIEVWRSEEAPDDLVDLNPREDVIELLRGGWLSFLRPVKEPVIAEGEREQGEIGGRIETLRDGPLSIRRGRGTGARPFRVEGSDGARLTLEGDEAFELRGDQVTLRGVMGEQVETVRPERMDVEGDVTWISGPNTFRSQSCQMTFDASGGFRRALLSGLPHARLLVAVDPDMASELPAEFEQKESATFDVRSDKTIEITRGLLGVKYVVAGLATVESEGIRLRSNGNLVGSRTDRGDEAKFHGTGGVVVEAGTTELEAAEFELRLALGEAGETTARGTASGGVRIRGKLPDGRSYTVSSPDSLEVERVGQDFRVVEGYQVELSVTDSDGTSVLFARCDHLIDLLLDDLSFRAEGHVLYRSGEDEAVCDRLEAVGESRFTMWGSEERKASFHSPTGTLEALLISRDGSRIEATGEVAAKVYSLPGGEDKLGREFDFYDLDCDELIVQRFAEDQGDVTVVRFFQLDAMGEVRSKLIMGDRTLELRHADEMHALRGDHMASDASDALRIGSETELRAAGSVTAHVLLIEAGAQPGQKPNVRELDVFCDDLLVTRTVVEEDSKEPELELLATGTVRFEGTRGLEFHGEGEILRISPDQTAHLDAPESGNVLLSGRLPTQRLPFRMTATRVDFSADRVEALNPSIRVTHSAKVGERQLELIAYRAHSKRLLATPRSLELLQEVRLTGSTEKLLPWTLDAQRVVLEGTPNAADEDRTEFSRISATGGIVFQLGPDVTARADALFGVKPTGVLHLTGDPAVIETASFFQYSDWIDFDPELQIIVETGPSRFEGKRAPRVKQGDGGASGPGVSPQAESQDEEQEVVWSLDSPWTTTRVDRDSFVFCLQQPVFQYSYSGGSAGTSEPKQPEFMRASWAILWVDRDRWESRDTFDEGQPTTEPAKETPQGPMRVFFDFLEERGVSGLVREAYFEGPVEIFSGEESVARADAVYFDLTSGHGWLSNATISVVGALVGQGFEELSIKANWLRHSSDGSLQADNATVTPCNYDDPHVKIVTGDLSLTPLSNEIDGGYQVSLRDNRIEMYELPNIPLPPIGFDTDEDLSPRLPSIRFGDSARFGQLFNFKFSRPAKRLGSWFHDLFTFGSAEEEPAKAEASAPIDKAERKRLRRERRKGRTFDARYDLDASYLGSRGASLDVGFTVKERSDRYSFEFLSAFVVDDGEDRGYVRVPEDERAGSRLWLRSTGWLDYGANRLLMSYSDQSDPGVQAEFFESEFLRYEEAQTYLQWKRSDGHAFTQASVKTRVDEFRPEVEELPAVTFFSGRAPIARIGSVPIVHTGVLEAGYLRRRSPSSFDLDGDNLDDGPLTSPFEGPGGYDDPFDPLGNREVVRADLIQAIEAPISLGFAGLKLSPFAIARGTAWDRAADEDDASRTSVEAGARLSTVFWKPLANGGYHQFSPYVSYRGDVDTQIEGTPHVFDDTEAALFGDFVEVGTRTRLGVRDGRSRFDLDLRGTHASARSDGAPDGWLPLEMFARAGIEPGGRVFDIWYDGRFDSEESEFIYSLFSLGTRFGDDAGLQLGHHYGRDEALFKIFDAATISGFYRWTEKWEFEARQTFSLLAEQRLGTSVLVRRYGHDMVFEIETDFREGEGTSLNFNVRPRLGYKPGRIGYTNW